jgi:UDP-N-acetylglucosamine--dolichyl-phosphate N-acetylglucosaminephosphotransferase
MTDYILVIPILASFFIVLFMMPYWIRKTKDLGLMWNDMNKLSDWGKISGSGGTVVVLGFVIGVLLYVAYRVFYLGNYNSNLVEIFALLIVILLLSGIGFIDDLFGWRKGGLSRRSRIVFVLVASIPLIAINAGRSIVNIPFFGLVDLGIIYPLIVIPIGIIGSTVTYNFLAGFNGLETGQGIILLSALGLISYYTENSWLSVVCLCMIFALMAFLIFNFFPARVFPGDVITYPIGGLIAIVAILGSFEKIAVFFFIPYIIEFGLKVRGKLVRQSFSLPHEKGIDLRYKKIYSLNHLSIYLMKKFGIRPGEKKVVISIWAFQILIIMIGLYIFREGIF